MKQDYELGLRISAKYNRIYIHCTTLKAMMNERKHHGND